MINWWPLLVAILLLIICRLARLCRHLIEILDGI